MTETMMVGLLVGLSIGLACFVFISVMLIVVNYKTSVAIKDEVRVLAEAVKKMAEALATMKEVIQFVHTRTLLATPDEQVLGEVISPATKR